MSPMHDDVGEISFKPTKRNRPLTLYHLAGWQAFNFLMVAWLLSANHVSPVHSPPAENGICLCQTEVSSLRPRIGNVQIKTGDTQRRGVHIFWGTKRLVAHHHHTHIARLILHAVNIYVLSRRPSENPRQTLGK